MGRNMINAIEAIYQDQSAAIKINNDNANYFKILKGTRQGCPLSPLVFIMAIEILLIKVRKDQDIKGLKYRDYQYKT